MGAIGAVLLVAFVIICVLSVLLVLVQEPDNSGMGGMLGGGNSAAFGSHSASVLTKTTVVFVILFFLLTFLLALMNKGAKTRTDLSDVATESGITTTSSKEESADWWKIQKATENSAESAAGTSGENAGASSESGEKTELIMNTENQAVVSE